MAVFSFPPEQQSPATKKQPSKPKKTHLTKTNKQTPSTLSSWDQIKNLLSCKQIQDSKIHDPSKNNLTTIIGSSCSSICPIGNIAHGNTRAVHRSDNSPEGSAALLSKKSSQWLSSSRSLSGSMRSTYIAGSSRGMQFRKLSGCYECHAIVDPTRYSLQRTTMSTCSECGEIFQKVESLEHHQAIRHAVSELGQDDPSRNIVEIIFKSSWLKKENPIYNIDRILKVHNTKRTIQQFEDCRDAIKSRAKKYPRCAADGNELLRFHCATVTCSLGAHDSTNLCGSVPGCGVCTIIRHGFEGNNKVGGVCTTASSGRAHDCLGRGHMRRAMLVCRVVAGRVKQHVLMDNVMCEEDGVGGVSPARAYDSIASCSGIYSNFEELYVFNPRAILPCFVVIYKAIQF